MTTTAVSTKYRATLWRGKKAWDWLALYTGDAGYSNRVRFRFGAWQGVRPRFRFSYLHVTPLHWEIDASSWEFGLCWGRRTIYVKRHHS